MEIKVIVLRSSDIKKLSDFYQLLGLKFDYHKHGNSAMHYAATIGQTVFEIYPLAKGQEHADKHLRLGFSLEDFDRVMERLRLNGTLILQEAIQTEFGLMSIIADPDERKIELYKK